MHESLVSSIPIPFEWAAKLNDEWTLHYSLIIGMDAKEDKIYILNPYGYEEILSFKDFFDRTSFNVYDNMPLFMKLVFDFGIFEKIQFL